MKHLLSASLALLFGIAADSASAKVVTYDTSGSDFTCGGIAGCSTGTNSITISSNGNYENITFSPTNSLVNDTPTSYVSYGYFHLSLDGSGFNVSPITFELKVSVNGGAAQTLSVGSFTVPFGDSFPAVTFSPLAGGVGGENFTVNSGPSYMSIYSDPQISGTIAAGAAPEASTWAMMLIGMAGLGFVAHRRSTKGVAAQA